MGKIDHIEASKVSWHSTHPEGTTYPGDENVKVACLQRIAKASEAMAKNHTQLLNELEQAKKDRDNYLDLYNRERADNRDLQRSISALKGVITRLKYQKKKEVNNG